MVKQENVIKTEWVFNEFGLNIRVNDHPVINEDHITQPHKKKQKWMSWEKTEKGAVGWSSSERKRWEV